MARLEERRVVTWGDTQERRVVTWGNTWEEESGNLGIHTGGGRGEW